MKSWLIKHYTGVLAFLVAANCTGWTWTIQSRVAALEAKERTDRLERIEQQLDRILENIEPMVAVNGSNVHIGVSVYRESKSK